MERINMNIYDRAIEKFGKESQMNMVQEECAELIQAVSKVRRFANNEAMKNLVEEIADVKIMLEQLERIFDIRFQVDEAISIKLMLLEDLIKVMK